MSDNRIDGFERAVFTHDDAGYDDARAIFSCSAHSTTRPDPQLLVGRASGGVPGRRDRPLLRAGGGLIVPSPSQQIAFPWGRNSADWPLASRQARWTVHPFGLWDDPAGDERGKAGRVPPATT